jgi:hypothetical protein
VIELQKIQKFVSAHSRATALVFYQECPFCARHHVTVQTALAASNALNRLPWNTKNDKLEIRSKPGNHRHEKPAAVADEITLSLT